MAEPYSLCSGKSSGVAEQIASHNWDFPDSVTTNGVHSIHPYPARFIPEIPKTLIQTLGLPRDTLVFDPFCGCGTTLVEAQALGFPSVGLDLHPIACLLTRVKTTPLPTTYLAASELCVESARSASSQRQPPVSLTIPNIDHWFSKEVQYTITTLLLAIDQITNDVTRDALRAALSSILVRVSFQDSDTRYARVDKAVKAADVYALFQSACKEVARVLLPLGSSRPTAYVVQKDIMDAVPGDIPGPVGLVITSPPYPNAYEYWLYHKYRMWWLGFDPLEVKSREIGARAHFFKRHHHTDQDFVRQMSHVLTLLKSVLVRSGYICIVIGRSIIHGQEIDNASIIRNLANDQHLLLVAEIERKIASSRKSFNLSHARIKTEKLLVFRKR